MSNKVYSSLFVACLFCAQLVSAQAVEDLSAHWDGVWVVDGTLFSIAVETENDEMRITQVESLGFEWSNELGKIDGNTVTVKVEYAGVTGTMQAELVDANTAVAFAVSCLPDFMVVCVLAKDREAIFRRVIE